MNSISDGHEETDLERNIYSEYKQKFSDIFEKYKIQNYKDLVIKSYKKLIGEIQKQFDALPVKVEFHNGDKNYENSDEMFDDIHNYKHMWVYNGGDDNPMLGIDTLDDNGYTANDKFRAVHDFFGHSVRGFQFGKNGEENAWLEHSKLFTPLAQMALTTETRGQNSYVNYSGC